MLGSRGTETGVTLYNEIKDNNPGAVYMTDYWSPYTEFLPEERHVQSKAETYTVEGFNSRTRHYLARFRRKGKCYSKSIEMLHYSELLLFEQLNNKLSILC
jgi:IS1 family transposase